jgi:hypothetical protein
MSVAPEDQAQGEMLNAGETAKKQPNAKPEGEPNGQPDSQPNFQASIRSKYLYTCAEA